MRVKLIRTDGPWLEAIVQHGNQQLCVMDGFSIDERSAPKPGEEFEAQFSAITDSSISWDAMFGGNPNKTKGLEPLKGWSYRALGQIVSIHPVLVDCGVLTVPDVFHTNDTRVVGDFIAFTISRLDAALR